MPDMDVIVKSLRRCSDMTVCPDDCYYRRYAPDCIEKLHKDAIALLKEQNELLKEQDELLEEKEAKWIEYPECLAYDGAYSNSHIVCSACEHVFSIMDNCTEEFDYCPHCGAKMKQKGGEQDA